MANGKRLPENNDNEADIKSQKYSSKDQQRKATDVNQKHQHRGHLTSLNI